MTGYTTRDVATLLSLSPRQVRRFARSGFLTPSRGRRRAYLFSFQDLVLLRAATGLTQARVPGRRVRRALRALRRQLPEGKPLSEVRITAENGRVLVMDGDQAWNPESGQLQLDFHVAHLAARARPAARRLAAAARENEAVLSAADWYRMGLDLEVSSSPEARDAYRRALELDPHHADAHVNLARLLQELGRPADAAVHCRLALATEPFHATAAFNLGVALEDLGHTDQAIQAYEQAVGADPSFADAYFNLAALYEKAGKRAAALRNLSQYKRLSQA
ncbi:MAG TPA: tetratricopeptide repeat protein [Gemmatimonadales bacterium]|nr:tetratricopeptide repeat protein [Gemmatimonadales bacterium]